MNIDRYKGYGVCDNCKLHEKNIIRIHAKYSTLELCENCFHKFKAILKEYDSKDLACDDISYYECPTCKGSGKVEDAEPCTSCGCTGLKRVEPDD